MPEMNLFIGSRRQQACCGSLFFSLCIMLHGGVFARLVLLWTWLLENPVDVGDWKAYGSAQLLGAVTIPYLWPCVCGYYMVDALEKPIRGTLWEQVFAGDGHHDG